MSEGEKVARNKRHWRSDLVSHMPSSSAVETSWVSAVVVPLAGTAVPAGMPLPAPHLSHPSLPSFPVSPVQGFAPCGLSLGMSPSLGTWWRGDKRVCRAGEAALGAALV